jgi:ubiquinone/menaquinone biosynthesis C-methylase UbiE
MSSEETAATPTVDDSLSRVAQCWNRTTASRSEHPFRGWLDSYHVASERLNARVTGAPSVNWLVGLARRLEVPSSSRWLSIGCGAAGQEIGAAQEGLFAHLDAIDIAPAALEEARRVAAAAGVGNVTFRELDFHRLEPRPESYDVVFMNMSLHHVAELDQLLSRIAASLTPNGFFLLNEYIGPSQFQFGDRQLSIVRDLLKALPEELRQDLTTGTTKTCYERRPVDYWNAVDPSEAVRSESIVPTLELYFDVVERIDYGGTILHLLLEHVIHNFDEGNAHHLAILRLLGGIEDVLIGQGVLASDFTVMALRRKDAPPRPAREPVTAPPAPASADADVAFLRRELAAARAYLRSVESSRGWRLLQGIRGLFGRRW